MKKIGLKLLFMVFLLVVCLSSFTGCTSRTEQLKVYNWGEYLDEDVIDMFEEWYEETTGNKVSVVYKEFESNEELLTSVEQGDDWDVACPSDYMIDRMIQSDLLLPLDSQTVADFKEVASDEIVDLSEGYDPGTDGNYYSVPYIWGTFGIMYNTNKGIEASDVTSWNALFDSQYANEITMKDQVRDSYAVAIIYAYREELMGYCYDETTGTYDYENEDYRALLESLFTEFDDERLAKAKTVLTEQKSILLKYESDNGKNEMAEDKGGSLGLYWSCDAGYAMNENDYGAGNLDLGYYVPDEGSNVWVDGWVIPKNAVNTDAANAWIQFMMTYDVAELNSEYAGASSVNAEVEADLREYYEADEDGLFEGKDEAFIEMYLDARFPSDETLKRCAVMGDFGDMYDAMSQMFIDVKLS